MALQRYARSARAVGGGDGWRRASTVMKWHLKHGRLFALFLLLNRKRRATRGTNTHIWTSPSAVPPLTGSASSPLSSQCSPPSRSCLCELLGMRGSHSLCVVISIDPSPVQHSFPADFLLFTLPPLLTLYPLIVPPPPIRLGCPTVNF